MASTDIVPFKSYELAKADIPGLASAIRANLGNDQVGFGTLDRIKIPSGGGIAWEVPDLMGEPTAEAKIDGVIVHQKVVRTFWKDSLDDTGGGTPPDCQSPDNVWGYGDPGDSLRSEDKGCEDCPHSRFGSADDGEGRGQACKQQRQLFLVRQGELLPVVLSLPPTSLHTATQFLWRLSSKALPFYGVVVQLGLEKVKGNGVPDYAKATFRVLEVLPPEDREKIRVYAEQLRPVFDRERAYDEQAAPGFTGRDAPPSGAADESDDVPLV